MSQTCGCGCDCGGKAVFVFPCSGSADVGEIADRAGRKLSADGTAKMFCLAGIGGRVSGIVKTSEAAGLLIAVDGCPLNCATKTLQEAGLTNIASISLSDLDLQKGQSPANEENIQRVVSAVTTCLTETNRE